VRAPHVETALAGLAARLGDDRILTGDESDLAAAATAAAAADAVIVVAGYTAREEGEFIPGDMTLGQAEASAATNRAPIGGDRGDLGLPADQVALIEVAIASRRPVIVVLVAGSAVLVEPWHDQVGAIMQSFYSGMAGGTALARLIFGDCCPSGRLPFSVARDAADYPFFDRDAASIVYDHWHGYALLAQRGRPARYPFGHGLSYAPIDSRAFAIRRAGDWLDASLAVTNHGAAAADHIVLLWAEAPGGVQPRWPRRLLAFTRITVAAGGTVIARLGAPIAALHHRNPAMHGWLLEPGRWHFHCAATAEAEPAQRIAIDF
jgi:beta-glucosidase